MIHDRKQDAGPEIVISGYTFVKSVRYFTVEKLVFVVLIVKTVTSSVSPMGLRTNCGEAACNQIS